MKTQTTLSVLLLSIAALVYSQTGEKNFIDQNYIEVIGKAEMEIVPDLIDLKIIIDENDIRGNTTVSELEKLMLDKLENIGVDLDKDLAVKDLTSNFKSHLILKTDIILSKEYILTVHDGKTAAGVFLELEKIGVSNISVENLDHSEMERFRKEVKINAVKAAKAKAEYLTGAIGQETGRALYIEELEWPMPYREVSNVTLRRATGSPESMEPVPDIEFDKIKLEYSVKVRFELK
jgi:uncharacterized protein YggE